MNTRHGVPAATRKHRPTRRAATYRPAGSDKVETSQPGRNHTAGPGAGDTKNTRTIPDARQKPRHGRECPNRPRWQANREYGRRYTQDTRRTLAGS